MSELVQIEHIGVSGSGWVPLASFTDYWGPVRGWTLVSGVVATYLPAPMRYRGVYGTAVLYQPGDVVSASEALWLALVPVSAVSPGADSTKWSGLDPSTIIDGGTP